MWRQEQNWSPTGLVRHPSLFGGLRSSNSKQLLCLLGKRDVRNPKKIELKLTESHTDTITEVSCLYQRLPHRLTPFQLQIYDTAVPLLLSASTDGLINIFNLEEPQNSEDDAPFQILNHASAVHHAGFLFSSSRFGSKAPNTEYVYGLSTDETFSIYPMVAPGEEEEEEEDGWEFDEPKPFGDVRRLMGCDYVIDVKAAVPLDVGDPTMAVGKHR